METGLTRARLTSRTTKVSHDLYLTGVNAPTSAHRSALLTVLPADAAISHASALELYGLPSLHSLPADDRLHVTLTPRRVLPQRREVVVHCRPLASADVTVLEGLRITTPPRLFADIAAEVTVEDLVVLGDAMLGRRLTSPELLADEVATSAGRRGVRAARIACGMLDGRAQSPPESIMRVRLARAGYPAEPQCPVTDGYGRTLAHLDLGYREYRVGVEYDGRHHAEAEQFTFDVNRHSMLSSRGWLVIRASARELMGSSRLLIQRVAAALRARGLDERPIIGELP
jgi:hypothetical protein